jgi:hypothetical protein
MISTFKISNIILHIVLISFLIIIIFITYGVYLEQEVMRHQISYLLEKVLGPIKIINSDKKIFDDKYLESLKSEDTEETKKEVDKNNRELLLKGGMINTILLFIAFVIIIIMGIKYEHKLDDGTELNFSRYITTLIKYNLFTLIFIAITYFSFVTYIGYNYIYIDDSKIGINIIEKIEEKLNL